MSYSLENARKFNWGSVTGKPDPIRLSHLDNYLVGQRVLDAGCAGGAYAELMTRKGYHVIGIDKHAPFLQLARESGPGMDWVQGDLISLPFHSKLFDSTYCFDVLEHLDDHLALQELARVTTRRLILTVPQEDDVMPNYNLSFLHYRDTTHLRYYTEASLRDLVSTIRYSKLTIFPELVIPLKNLVQDLVKFNLGMLARVELKLLALISRIQNRLGLRTFDIKTFLDMHTYRTLYSGLVAVVDL
jgi:SAM-dependent methyltransferase